MKFKTYGNRNQFTRVFSRLSLDRYFVIFFLIGQDVEGKFGRA